MQENDGEREPKLTRRMMAAELHETACIICKSPAKNTRDLLHLQLFPQYQYVLGNLGVNDEAV